MTRFLGLFASLLLLGSLPATLRAKDEPLTAGSGGVPVPKRANTVKPEYPAEAQAQGIRGIVILELVIDKEGKVVDARIVRSVPGLDEAALTAARQWTYEVTKVDGKPVSLRLTVPITFAMKLPEITRQEGIPELRQGVVPPFPPDAKGPATVVVAATLDAEGRVAEAQVVQGEAPWTNALMAALRTWRFAAESTEATLSFRVQADFIPAEKKGPGRVVLRLDGVHRSESLVGGAPEASPPATPAASAAPPSAPVSASAAPPSAPVSPAAAPPAAPSAASMPAPATPTKANADPVKPPAAASPEAPSPTTAVASSAPPAAAATPPGSPASAQSPPATGAAPPPVEVITAPPPPAPAPDPENRTSSLRDVQLEAGGAAHPVARTPGSPPFPPVSAASGAARGQFPEGPRGASI